MIWYNLYIFNRQGVCLYYHEWSRPRSVVSQAEDQKLMFGLLFQLKKNFVPLLDPTGGQDGSCSFHSFRTEVYKLHFLESPSGLRFALLTEPRAGDLRECLRYIYNACYVEYVTKNPLYTPGEPFTCKQFTTELLKYEKSINSERRN